MLEPDSRVVLLDQLRPPAGYQLEAAVATTFTLGLHTALIPPLAFSSLALRGTPDPITALEAVRACAEKIDIFAQSGQIFAPPVASDLVAFLEQMVHPVKRPRPGYLFHPKVWFLQYQPSEPTPQPAKYRLLCSSRNLADSAAWEAVVTLDGEAGARPSRERQAQNAPLAALLRQLPKWAVHGLAPERLQRIEILAEAARNVVWELPDGATDLNFHAFGVPYLKANPNFTGARQLIISPFMNDKGIELIAGRRKSNTTLVSTTAALDGLSPQTVKNAGTLYIIDPLAVLNTSNPGDDDGDNRRVPEIDTLSGLHAKITVVERGFKSHLFIGSPNATHNAYGGNVEFSVEIIGPKKQFGIDAIMGSPDDGDGLLGILEEYPTGGGISPDLQDDLIRKLRNQLRALAEIPFSLKVEPESDHYRLNLFSEKPLQLNSQYELNAALITNPGVAKSLTNQAKANVWFEPVQLADITPFVMVTIRDARNSTPSNPLELTTVIPAKLLDDPADRLDVVLARQVDTPEKFLKFLALLLGLTDANALLGLINGEVETSGGWGSGTSLGAGVFELLLNALAKRPQSLIELKPLVDRLRKTAQGTDILPAGFAQLWDAVNSALEVLVAREVPDECI